MMANSSWCIRSLVIAMFACVAQANTDELCIRWQQTNFADSCAQTGMRREGSAFFSVNNVPIPTYTSSMRASSLCPNPHFEDAGFSCGTGPGGTSVQQQWFQACFDKVHLLLGDNIFDFSVSVNLGPAIDLNRCTHMMHAALLKLPSGQDLLLFAVTHAGTEVSETKNANLSLSKLDPAMAAELQTYMELLNKKIAQMENLQRIAQGAWALKRQVQELETIDQEIERLQRETSENRALLERQITAISSQRADLAYVENVVDEGELLKKLYTQLKVVLGGPIAPVTIPALLKLVLEHKNIFRNRDLATLAGFVEEIAERAKGPKTEIDRAMRAATEKLEALKSTLDDINAGDSDKVSNDFLSTEQHINEMFQQKVIAGRNGGSCTGSASKLFRDIGHQTLKDLQKTVSGSKVVDRRAFFKHYKKWVTQQILASKTVTATQNVCREDIVALEQSNAQVREFVSRHFDEKGGWFLSANIPRELREGIDNYLAKLEPQLAKKLREELNFWSYGDKLTPTQELFAQTITNLIEGFRALAAERAANHQEIAKVKSLLMEVVDVFVESAVQVADAGIGMVPLVGDFRDLCEALTGRHNCLPHGELLSTEDRIYAGIGVIAGSGAFWKGVGKVAKGEVKAVAETIGEKAAKGKLSKFPGPAAKGFDWEHIMKRHGPNGIIAKQRTKGTVFVGLTEKQIKARVKAAWQKREKIKSQIREDGSVGILYRGIDPLSGQTVDFWFSESTKIVETAFPVFVGAKK